MATMLLAGVLFSLPITPDLHAQSLVLTYYMRSQINRSGCVESQFQAPSNYVYALVWNTANDYWSHTPFGSGTSWNNTWVNECGVDSGADYSTHWPPGSNSALREVTQWVEGPNGYYTNYTETLGHWGNYIGWVPWRKCYQVTRTTNTHEASGIVYGNTDTLNEEARIELWTGGDPAVTNTDNIFVVSVRATDDSNSTPIPVSELTMLGQMPTPEGTNIYLGEVWKKDVADHQKIPATPTASRSCYSYAASASKDRLVIIGNVAGGELNGKTNLVYVGERINLSIRHGLITAKAGVTNYKWSVPGYRIGYWNAIVPRAHTTPFDSTNRYAVEFFWVDAIASAVVTCSVEVGGHTLTASTTFEVRKPTATWNLNPLGPYPVVANACKPAAPEYAGYYHLTTGEYPLATSPNYGMYYWYEITDLKGYTNAYEASFIQTVFIDWQGDLDTPTPKSWTITMTGLDSGDPPDATVFYSKYGWDNAAWSKDTPRGVLLDSERYRSRRDKYACWLMWQPTRRPFSIPVPLKLAQWTWRGGAQNVGGGTVPETWVRTGYTRAQPQTGFDYSIHPTWDTNVTFVGTVALRTTNDFWYGSP
jgi:hypothetical protein